jgi:hypothetical protein
MYADVLGGKLDEVCFRLTPHALIDDIGDAGSKRHAIGC